MPPSLDLKILLPYIRGQVIAFRDSGLKWSAISAKLRLPISTCYNIFLRRDSPNGASAPRSGRPREWSKRDERKIIRIARLYPKYSYEQLRFEAGVTLSNTTLR
jgi:hypothetical protein